MLPTPDINNLDYDKVYEPAEDSYLLLDCFEQEQKYLQTKFVEKLAIVTEIGTGSGIVTSFIQQNVLPLSLFIATDLNPHACKAALKTINDNQQNKAPFVMDTIQMNLTTGIRSNQTDVLIFNPPYVPAEDVPTTPVIEEDSTWLDLALLGGEKGMVITWKVLDNLDLILSDDGIAYILFCARNLPDEVTKVMEDRGWDVETIIYRKAGWEVLSVLRFMKK